MNHDTRKQVGKGVIKPGVLKKSWCVKDEVWLEKILEKEKMV